MSAVLNLTAAKIKEVFQKESPGINVEKGVEVLMLLKGLNLEEKPDIPSSHSDHWKRIQEEVLGKENEFKQSLIDFNHYKKLDEKTWKHIVEIMHDSELDQKVIKYQVNPASALITWANASFHLMKALQAVPDDKLKDIETIHLS